VVFGKWIVHSQWDVIQACSTFFTAPPISDISPLRAIIFSLFKLSAFYTTASIFTTSEIKVVSTSNSTEIKDFLAVKNEHHWVIFNKGFFTM